MPVIEFPLANIARVDIVTEEEVPVTHTLVDVASEASAEATVSEGAIQELRVKNTIKALSELEDIVTGYGVTLSTVTLLPEVLALVDGGTWDAQNQEYSAPPVGTPVNRTPFTLKVYTEDKDVNGDTLGYVRFTFPHCKGTPVNYSFKDGEFFVGEMTLKSRPASGESPCSFAYLEALPV